MSFFGVLLRIILRLPADSLEQGLTILFYMWPLPVFKPCALLLKCWIPPKPLINFAYVVVWKKNVMRWVISSTWYTGECGHSV